MFQKWDPQSAPKSTWDPKTPLKGLRRAKIGTNASHSVQLTTLGPKKPDLNPTPQRSVPFTWNPPNRTRLAGLKSEPIVFPAQEQPKYLGLWWC